MSRAKKLNILAEAFPETAQSISLPDNYASPVFSALQMIYKPFYGYSYPTFNTQPQMQLTHQSQQQAPPQFHYFMCAVSTNTIVVGEVLKQPNERCVNVKAAVNDPTLSEVCKGNVVVFYKAPPTF